MRTWRQFWATYFVFALLCAGIAVSCGGCSPLDAALSTLNASTEFVPQKTVSLADWRSPPAGDPWGMKGVVR